MHNKFLWGLWILMMMSFCLVLLTKLTDGEATGLVQITISSSLN